MSRTPAASREKLVAPKRLLLKQQVIDGVRACVQDEENGPDIRRSLNED